VPSPHDPQALVEIPDGVEQRRLERIADAMLLADRLQPLTKVPQKRWVEDWCNVVLNLHVQASEEQGRPIAPPTATLRQLQPQPCIDLKPRVVRRRLGAAAVRRHVCMRMGHGKLVGDEDACEGLQRQ